MFLRPSSRAAFPQSKPVLRLPPPLVPTKPTEPDKPLPCIKLSLSSYVRSYAQYMEERKATVGDESTDEDDEDESDVDIDIVKPAITRVDNTMTFASPVLIPTQPQDTRRKPVTPSRYFNTVHPSDAISLPLIAGRDIPSEFWMFVRAPMVVDYYLHTAFGVRVGSALTNLKFETRDKIDEVYNTCIEFRVDNNAKWYNLLVHGADANNTQHQSSVQKSVVWMRMDDKAKLMLYMMFNGTLFYQDSQVVIPKDVPIAFNRALSCYGQEDNIPWYSPSLHHRLIRSVWLPGLNIFVQRYVYQNNAPQIPLTAATAVALVIMVCNHIATVRNVSAVLYEALVMYMFNRVSGKKDSDLDPVRKEGYVDVISGYATVLSQFGDVLNGYAGVIASFLKDPLTMTTKPAKECTPKETVIRAILANIIDMDEVWDKREFYESRLLDITSVPVVAVDHVRAEVDLLKAKKNWAIRDVRENASWFQVGASPYEISRNVRFLQGSIVSNPYWMVGGYMRGDVSSSLFAGRWYSGILLTLASRLSMDWHPSSSSSSIVLYPVAAEIARLLHSSAESDMGKIVWSYFVKWVCSGGDNVVDVLPYDLFLRVIHWTATTKFTNMPSTLVGPWFVLYVQSFKPRVLFQMDDFHFAKMDSLIRRHASTNDGDVTFPRGYDGVGVLSLLPLECKTREVSGIQKSYLDGAGMRTLLANLAMVCDLQDAKHAKQWLSSVLVCDDEKGVPIGCMALGVKPPDYVSIPGCWKALVRPCDTGMSCSSFPMSTLCSVLCAMETSLKGVGYTIREVDDVSGFQFPLYSINGKSVFVGDAVLLAPSAHNNTIFTDEFMHLFSTHESIGSLLLLCQEKYDRMYVVRHGAE